MNSTRQKLLSAHHNKHGVRGVFWDNRAKRFRAYIGDDKKNKRRALGSFETAHDAALAYDIAAIDIYGEDAALNFPNQLERPTKFASGCTVHGLANIYISQDGRRHCRICNRDAAAKYKARRDTDDNRNNGR